MTSGKRIHVALVDPGLTEADVDVARANAMTNFNRMAEEVPLAIQQLEAGLENHIRQEKGSALRKLRRLYKEMEPVMAALAPYLACRPGCSGCCHYPIGVMPIEADLIASRTGKRLLTGGPGARTGTLVRQEDTPCPFLVDNQCSIYDDRPMACRKHVALTNTAYWCQPERANDHAFPMAGLSTLTAAFEYVIALDGRGMPRDIRDYFGHAPSTP
ncbi:MAG TPA: YkgJ family cysteine cluster protein [Arenimonas sp.]|uniref:YkgJ family cysteine cluster protein n=1 Tax=Arenimonas sp. TaxID=1872635 RepID=UPI002D7F2DF9|nr:YkgJ family cysteine cluster protein [Arenimonas sp.]HEU0153172.1 YkgJ family cysteine cluster protein [Arenimonas sp.]